MTPPRDRVPDNLDPAYLPLRSWPEVRAKLLITVPLSRWATHGTFDTANACNAELARHQDRTMQGLDTALRSGETRAQQAANEEMRWPIGGSVSASPRTTRGCADGALGGSR